MNPEHTEILKNVYWIGGSTGAAKSTIARRISEEYYFVLYDTDKTMREHGGRAEPGECPLFEAFCEMNMDERWANRSPQEMYETFQWFHGEAFRFIIDDLLEMAAGSRVIVEGFRLLPQLVRPWLVHSHQAVWLIATHEFRVKAFTERGTLWKIPNKTTQPEKALKNHLEREVIFAEHLDREVREEGLNFITVDGSLNEDELHQRICRQFNIG